MKIYGPFRGINNPLVMGMLGLQALNEGTQLVQAIHEGQQRDLLAQSLTSGEPVASEPGGPIRRGLSTITGGLVSPDVQADPQTLLIERQAQQKAQADKLKGLTSVLGLRDKLGPGPFTSGAPLDLLAQQYGAEPGMVSGETDKERKDRIAQQQKTPEYQASVAGAKKQRELDITNEPTNVAAVLGLTRAKAEVSSAAHEAAALDTARREIPLKAEAASAEELSRLAVAASPLGISLKRKGLELTADVANDKLAQRDRQKRDELNATPVSDLASNKTSGGVYVRKSDLKLATGVSGEPTTKAEADRNPDYQFVPNKQVDGPGGLKDTISQVKKINEMLQLIDSGAADDIFPSGKNKNTGAIFKDRVDYGTVNNIKRGSDPVRNKWYNMYADLVRYYTGLQHRYPNTKELQIPLVPDPGGLVPSEHPVLHLGGANPFRMADAKEVARQKLTDMRDTILGHFSTGAGIGTLEADDEDATDFADAARKSGAMK